MENNKNSRFFDLAMMKICGRASDAELAELDELLVADASLQDEYKRLVAESQLLKEALPLASATQATEGEFPEWARANLQMEVQEVLGKPEAKLQQTGATKPSGFNFWAWGLGASAVWSCVVLILVVVDTAKDPDPSTQMASKADAPSQKTALIAFHTQPAMDSQETHHILLPSILTNITQLTRMESQLETQTTSTSPVIIQLAMLDGAGETRGAQDTAKKDLQKAWPGAKVEKFNDSEKLKNDWLWTGGFNPELVGKPMDADKLLASLDLIDSTKGSISPVERLENEISSVRPIAKVLYISSTGELKIIFQEPDNGKIVELSSRIGLQERTANLYEKTFPVGDDLPGALKKAKEFLDKVYR